MEPTTLAAATITALFASEAAKAGGKAFGEGTSKLVSQLIAIIRNKFRSAETEGLLTRVEKEPTASNIDRFKAELLIHIEEDKEFSAQLKELLASSEVAEEIYQMGLENVRSEGDFAIKDLGQEVDGGQHVSQTGIRNLNTLGDIDIKRINQKRSKS